MCRCERGSSNATINIKKIDKNMQKVVSNTFELKNRQNAKLMRGDIKTVEDRKSTRLNSSHA